MQRTYFFKKRFVEAGQGLVEYALILVLVAVVVIAILLILGPQIGQTFNQVVCALGSGGCDVVVITKADYNSSSHELHLDATSNGGHNPGVTLTASPGGVMEAKSNHYHLKFTLTGCPCTITVSSSGGGSASVTVGP